MGARRNRIELGGDMPMNTTAACSPSTRWGLNNVVEVVRQLRHEAGARQVADASSRSSPATATRRRLCAVLGRNR